MIQYMDVYSTVYSVVKCKLRSIDRDIQTHTPGVCIDLPFVGHPARIHIPFIWGEAHMFGQVVVPVLLKGQVSLGGSRNHVSIPENVNLDFWWVEAAHMTDDAVGFPELSW